MASLTTTAGEAIDFDPAAVTALSDRDPETGEAVTLIYGLAAGELKVSERVDALLHRLQLAADFARLTRPDGASVWVAGKAVAFVRAPWEGEYVPGVHAVVSAGALIQGVTETVEEVRRRVDAQGGAL